VNRETRRLSDNDDGGDDFGAMGGAGGIGGGGVGVIGDRVPSDRGATGRRRTSPLQFLREVGDELRQVSWPTRSEMVNYTAVVFFTLVLMIGLIFLLNLGLGKAVVYMFQK
jgi:preprotein translocase subunit SecE